MLCQYKIYPNVLFIVHTIAIAYENHAHITLMITLTHSHIHTHQLEYLLLPQVLFHLTPQQQPTHNLEQQQGPPPQLDLHKTAAQISHLGLSLHQLGLHLKGE